MSHTFRMSGWALSSIIVALVLPSMFAFACILVLSRWKHDSNWRLQSELIRVNPTPNTFRLFLLARFFMGRDLSPNYLCPYLQAGWIVLISNPHINQLILSSSLVEFPPALAAPHPLTLLPHSLGQALHLLLSCHDRWCSSHSGKLLVPMFQARF